MKPYLEVHPWKVVESGWNPEDVRRSESIFSIGNGRFGQRANFEEGYSGDSLLGSYVGGVYYPDKTRVGWWKNGYPEYFAKVLNATNWIAIRLKVNGMVVDLNTAEVLSFQRILDMKRGVLSRNVRLKLANDVVIRLEAERFCSLAQQDVAAIRYKVSAETAAAVEIETGLDGNISNEDTNWNDRFWDILECSAHEEGLATLVNRTFKTEFTVGTSMVCDVWKDGKWMESTGARVTDASAWVNHAIELHAEETLQVVKYVGIASSLHHEADVCGETSQAFALQASEQGFDALMAEHEAAWDRIWQHADIEIEGDDEAQQGIRFNIFHLNQTYQGDDPRLNIGPKGFTGEKYGGASYWDTEAYCLPFYLASHPPHVAQQLLKYRYNQLDKAIENAEKLGFHSGAALYPMVTMNGEECHNEWEITFEEIHRNGAMSYAIMNHERFTGDTPYTDEFGFPVLLGVARFWAQRVNWSEEKQAYVILGVTGPNEYENNVNNNWYTNFLAAWSMRYAGLIADRLATEAPELLQQHVRTWNFDPIAEPADWKKKSDQMYYPETSGGIRLQQDGFLDKEQLTVADLPADKRPINQHWSWDRILRSIFIKQADVLQGFYFFESEFSRDELEANFDFYEPKTVHESSLSPCIHVVLAAQLDRIDKAYEMYLRTSRLDLDDYNHEAYQGLHITSMAGTWLSVVEGFGGFRVKDGIPAFNGKLPANWTSLTFKIGFRQRQLSVTVDASGTHVRLLSGEDLTVEIEGSHVQVSSNAAAR